MSRVPRAKLRTWPGALANLSGLALLGLLAFASSSLAGQTMMESARRDGLQAQERARKARVEAAALRRHVDRLTSMRSVKHWTEVRRFQPAVDLPQGNPTPEIARVASR